MSDIDFEAAETPEILRWAFDTYGDGAAMSTAFGPSGMVLMHLASRIRPGLRVFFIDTGFHFPTTLDMVDRARARLDVNIEVIRPRLTVEEQVERHGDALPVLNPDLCCSIRKVEPNERVLRGLDAWLTALRRDQGPSRANTPVLEHKRVGDHMLAKINPLVRWTRSQVWNHILAHELPYNPLHDSGYPSIGCWPCTRQASDPTDERSGRWVGRAKTECGLHTRL